MAKILITGGAGFIGSYIAQGFLHEGHTVIIFDNFSFGKLDNISSIKDKIEIIKGDIRDYDALNSALKGVDFVSHQAGLRSVPFSVKNPEEFNDVNIAGHLNLLKACVENKVQRVAFASSSSVYGNCEEFPQKENLETNPLSPYSITKLTGEKYNTYFSKQFGLETVSLRYFNVFGERQDPKSEYSAVIPLFFRSCINGEQPTVHWDGLQSRDFTYVKNNVHANLCAFNTNNKLTGDVVNVSSGSTISIISILKMISESLDVHVKPIFTPRRDGDVRKTMGSPIKAKSLIGYEAIVSFEEGLKNTLLWFKQNPEVLK